MKTQLLKDVRDAVNNWWMPLVMGLLFILISLLILLYPIASYASLSILFSIGIFVAGVIEILFYAGNRQALSGWYLAGGIIDLLLGFILILFPAILMAVLPYIMAFWLLFRGVSAIGFAMDLKTFKHRNWGWHLSFGLLGVLMGLLMVFEPLVGIFWIVYALSLAFFIIGLFRVILAFDLRSIHKHCQKVKKELKETAV